MKDVHEKVYIGDAVYVRFDQFNSIVMTTEDGVRATNTITLEPEVVHAFRLYVDQLNRMIESLGGRPI